MKLPKVPKVHWVPPEWLTRTRLIILGVTAVVVVGGLIAIIDPFSGKAAQQSAASATSIATVERSSLSSQTQVSATLEYSGSYTVTAPSGTTPQQLAQDQEAVATDQTTLANAEASSSNVLDAAAITQAQQSLSGDQAKQQSDQAVLAADQGTLGGDQAQLQADQGKESNDCAGTGSTSTQCAADQQKVSGDQSKVISDQQKVSADNQVITSDSQKISSDQTNISSAESKANQDATQSSGQIASDQQKLADDQAALATAQQQAAIQSAAYSALPAVGAVITQGEVLYAVGTTNVALLYGTIPMTRNMYSGESGPDIAQLNADLAALGYTAAPSGSSVFTSATASAVSAFQTHIGDPATGNIPLGEVVFLPTDARITAVSAILGATGGGTAGGGTILTASSTDRQVVISLDADLAPDVKVGDPVTITLPDNSTTPGTVTTVGTVATCPSSSGGGGGGSGVCSGNGTPSIEVDVTPTHAKATGTLDQAPVQVSITNQTVNDVLVVPVTALLALSGGGYALEVVPPTGAHYLVAVTTGLFDDAQGLVQVSGQGLAEGMHVVVPSS